jgi:hypothetical protein
VSEGREGGREGGREVPREGGLLALLDGGDEEGEGFVFGVVAYLFQIA